MESPKVEELRALLREERARFALERAAFERDRAHFRSLFEGMGEGMIVTDLSDRILSVNGRMVQMCGFSREELLGQVAYQMFLPPDEWGCMEWRKERRVAGQADSYEIKMRHKDGSRVWLEVHATPLFDEAGQVVGTIGAQIDITQRRMVRVRSGRSRGSLTVW